MQRLIRAKWVRRGFTGLHWGLALLPTFFGLSLVGMSVRAAQLLGKVPQPSIDDPYLFGESDPVYQALIRFTDLFFSLTVLSWIPWFCLTALTLLFHWRYWAKDESKRVRLYRFLPIGLYVLSHLIILFEPTNRFGWFLD